MLFSLKLVVIWGGPLGETYTITKRDMQENCNTLSNNGEQKAVFNPLTTYTITRNDNEDVTSNHSEPYDASKYMRRPSNTGYQLGATNATLSLDHSKVSRLNLDGEMVSKDCLLNRLQAQSSTKLLPANFPRQNDFTKSLRNNTNYNHRAMSTRGKPVKASNILGEQENFERAASLISQDLKSTRVCDVMARIKSNKPSCDMDFYNVRKGIERQHINMFGRRIIQNSDTAGSNILSDSRSVSTKNSARDPFARGQRSKSMDRLMKSKHIAGNDLVSSRTRSFGSRESLKSLQSNNLSSTRCASIASQPGVQSVRPRGNINTRPAQQRSRTDVDIRREHPVNDQPRDVPPINLREIDPTVEEVPGNLAHDSLLHCNLVHSTDNDAVSRDIKLPLNLPGDAKGRVNANAYNTLELNLPHRTTPYSPKLSGNTTPVFTQELGIGRTEGGSVASTTNVEGTSSASVATNNKGVEEKKTSSSYLDRIIEVSSESSSSVKDKDSNSPHINKNNHNNNNNIVVTGRDSQPSSQEDDYATSTPRSPGTTRGCNPPMSRQHQVRSKLTS